MSRHERRAQRASMQRYRKEAGGSLLTFLLDVREPITAPTLAAAAAWWLNLLPASSRPCFMCGAVFSTRSDVAALLMSTPALTSTAVSINGLCHRCWHSAPFSTIEAAAERVLSSVMRGKLDPMLTSVPTNTMGG